MISHSEKILYWFPPIKSIAKTNPENIIWEYSAKKNNAKGMEEYSTLYPDTSSDSPSERSNGALFVSANMDTK